MKKYIRLTALMLCLLLLAGCAASPDRNGEDNTSQSTGDIADIGGEVTEDTANVGGADDGEVLLEQEEMFLTINNGKEDLDELAHVTGLKKLYLSISATDANIGMDIALDAYSLGELTYLAISSEVSLGTLTLPDAAMSYCSIYLPQGEVAALTQPSGSVYELSLQLPKSDMSTLLASLSDWQTLASLELTADLLTDVSAVGGMSGLYTLGLIFTTETDRELERDWSLFYAEDTDALKTELLTHWDEAVVTVVTEQLSDFLARGGAVATTLTAA